MLRGICFLIALLCCTPSAFAAKWYEGGTLHGDNLTAWSISTDQNQLATMADFVATWTAPETLRKLNQQTLRDASETVRECINMSIDQKLLAKNVMVRQAAWSCMEANKGNYAFFLTAGEKPKLSLEERIAAANEAISLDANKKEDSAEDAERRAEYEKNTSWLREEVASLLAELDGFRNSRAFKECIYGCGKDNPGSAWERKRKALQAQMKPQLNAPIELKALPTELWQLGMDYGKGKDAEAARLRKKIENVLATANQN